VIPEPKVILVQEIKVIQVHRETRVLPETLEVKAILVLTATQELRVTLV
jgi:hypothetical protein